MGIGPATWTTEGEMQGDVKAGLAADGATFHPVPTLPGAGVPDLLATIDGEQLVLELKHGLTRPREIIAAAAQAHCYAVALGDLWRPVVVIDGTSRDTFILEDGPIRETLMRLGVELWAARRLDGSFDGIEYVVPGDEPPIAEQDRENFEAMLP